MTLPSLPVPIVFIEEEAYSASEEEGSVSLVVIRQGDLSPSAAVLLSTVEDSAVGETNLYAVGIHICMCFLSKDKSSVIVDTWKPSQHPIS